MPTHNDGEVINEKALRQLIDYQLGNGIDGICLFSSTGGNGSFSNDEMRKTTAIAVKHVDGRVPVIAGTGARTTYDCIELSKHAESVGCDGVLVLPVSYWPLTTDEVYEHYSRVSGSISIPICVYNVPLTTGVDLKPELLAKISMLENVSCIKESSGDLTRITAIRLLTNGLVAILVGWESSSFQAFAAGATGWACVYSNFVPEKALEFYRAAVHDSDLCRARNLWDGLFPLCDFIGAKTHIRVIHTGLEILGWPVGEPRRPIRMLNADDRTQLQIVLRECGAKAAAL